ncbi:Ataxin-2-like protein [Aphelenchoides besseyi]|nr:Ataxin-2-like protein [Aphelenchoides besseyi]KAI6208496.1 Ataxin-2-like protein [Aphelenchoides besseyi]
MNRFDLTFKQMTDELGNDVTIETRNGQIYRGKVEAFSDDKVIALSNVNVKQGPYSDWDKEEAVTINLVDIRKYDSSRVYNKDETTKSGSKKRKTKTKNRAFLTDREYGTNDHNVSGDFQAWVPEDDDDGPQNDLSVKEIRRGWSVQDMYDVNNKLGVKSSYKDLGEYSTAAPVGDEKARKRAEKIAKEIENNAESRYNATLENEDEERDIVGPEDEPEIVVIKSTELEIPTKTVEESVMLEESEKELEMGPEKEVDEVIEPPASEALEAEVRNEETANVDDQHFSFNPEAPEFVPNPLPNVVEDVLTPVAYVHPPPTISMPISSYAGIPQVQPLSPSGPMYVVVPPQYSYPYPVMSNQMQPASLVYAQPRLQTHVQYPPPFGMPTIAPLATWQPQMPPMSISYAANGWQY